MNYELKVGGLHFCEVDTSHMMIVNIIISAMIFYILLLTRYIAQIHERCIYCSIN